MKKPWQRLTLDEKMAVAFPVEPEKIVVALPYIPKRGRKAYIKKVKPNNVVYITPSRVPKLYWNEAEKVFGACCFIRIVNSDYTACKVSPTARSIKKSTIASYKRHEARKYVDKSCSYCDSETNLHVHHIIPLSKQGTNDLSNLVTVCKPCHRQLHPELPDILFK